MPVQVSRPPLPSAAVGGLRQTCVSRARGRPPSPRREEGGVCHCSTSRLLRLQPGLGEGEESTRPFPSLAALLFRRKERLRRRVARPGAEVTGPGGFRGREPRRRRHQAVQARRGGSVHTVRAFQRRRAIPGALPGREVEGKALPPEVPPRLRDVPSQRVAGLRHGRERRHPVRHRPGAVHPHRPHRQRRRLRAGGRSRVSHGGGGRGPVSASMTMVAGPDRDGGQPGARRRA